MLLIGGCLTVGFVCAAVAALQPSLSSVWTTSSAYAVTLIADERSDAWQLANRMFAIGIWFTVAGLAALTMVLGRRSREPMLSGAALALATAAATLWTVNLTFRLTVMTSVAAAGPAVPDWYPHISFWADEGLLTAAALIGGPAMILYGLAVVTERVLARWTGWFSAGCGLLLLGQAVPTGDVVPALLYLAPLPLGIAALLRAARAAPAAVEPAAPSSTLLGRGVSAWCPLWMPVHFVM